MSLCVVQITGASPVGNITISNCTLRNNAAGASGAVLALSKVQLAGRLALAGVTAEGNSAALCGGVASIGSASAVAEGVDVRASSFLVNSAGERALGRLAPGLVGTCQ